MNDGMRVTGMFEHTRNPNQRQGDEAMAKAALIVSPNPALPQPNVSALAREFNVSPRTIRRWRAKGWAPPAPAAIRILPQDQLVPTLAHPPGHRLSFVLIVVAIGIAIPRPRD